MYGYPVTPAFMLKIISNCIGRYLRALLSQTWKPARPARDGIHNSVRHGTAEKGKRGHQDKSLLVMDPPPPQLCRRGHFVSLPCAGHALIAPAEASTAVPDLHEHAKGP
jgi:hypothetical protein